MLTGRVREDAGVVGTAHEGRRAVCGPRHFYRGKSSPVLGSLIGCLLFAARNCADIS